MVSTRSHPDSFTPPTTSPSKILTRSSQTTAREEWSHTPSNLTLIWLIISLPLVIWDAGYVMLRPHSMPGGYLHSPLWTPYGLYGTVDYMYGWKAWNEHNGFTAAQTSLNIVETIMYGYYLWIVYSYGTSTKTKGRGAPGPNTAGWFGEAKSISGHMGALATLVGLSASVMTVSKTLLYWLNEYYSRFDNIGHNDFFSLMFLWIIPNGAWIVLPTYMTYVFAQEILQGLAIASHSSSSSEGHLTYKAD
ncbi:MAG: hypothetical protein M1836_007346 [Candelina mexicana]|nr:MAG: hypothetical protein M1836_007346 [Candelina mexicana]